MYLLYLSISQMINKAILYLGWTYSQQLFWMIRNQYPLLSVPVIPSKSMYCHKYLTINKIYSLKHFLPLPCNLASHFEMLSAPWRSDALTKKSRPNLVEISRNQNQQSFTAAPAAVEKSKIKLFGSFVSDNILQDHNLSELKGKILNGQFHKN